jgi:hypothetical protein
MLQGIAFHEAGLAIVTRDHDALRAVADGHNARKEAIRAVLRPGSRIRLASALLDGLEVTEADVDVERAAQTLASRRAAKLYDTQHRIIRSINTCMAYHAGLAEIAAGATRVARRDIGAFAEEVSSIQVIIWLWPTELADADEQAASAIGLSYIRDSIVLVDADFNEVGTAANLADALVFAGRWMKTAAADAEDEADWGCDYDNTSMDW